MQITSYSAEERLSIYDKAIQLINKHYGIEIRTATRKRKFTEARYLFIYLMKERIQMKLINIELGNVINKHRTTVTTSAKIMAHWIKHYDELAQIATEIGEQLDNFIITKIQANEKSN